MTRHPVVILVHGTFAPGAKWTQPGSLVRRTIRKKLGPEVEFRPFYWSGRNSHRARLQAGAMLARLLEKHAVKDPDAVRFLVSHSHGGNVALYAMRDADAGARVGGLVSFNTPYIECVRRNVWSYIFVLAALLAVLLGGTIMLIDVASAGFQGLQFGTLAVAGIFWTFTANLARKLFKGVKSRQKPIVDRLSHAVDASLNFELYCAVNRETDIIGWWLRAIDFMSSLGHRLWRWYYFVAVGLVGLGATLYVQRGDVESTSLLYVILLALVAGVAFVVGFIILIEAAMLVLPRIFRSHGLGFGWEVPGTNWLVKITPEDKPPGFPDSVCHSHSTGSLLGHDLYADRGCVTTVAKAIGTMYEFHAPSS